MNEEIFVNYLNMSVKELKLLISKQTKQLENKINGNITELEKENSGFLFWNCKMILVNIYMACDKILKKYKDNLTNEEIKYYNNISNVIKKEEEKWKNMDDIKYTFKNLSFVDYSSEEINNTQQEQFYDKICEILQVDKYYILNNNKRLNDISATYYWSFGKGGCSLIVSDDGSYLGATSTIDLDKHIEEFKKGTRNKKF